MKILLTSQGLYNKTISKTLFELFDKRPSQIKVAFIPTAANIIDADKGWLIDDLMNIKKQNFSSIDIVDISSLSEKEWRPRLEKADLLFFGGGDPFYLISWFQKSGLDKMLPELLKTRVYIGSSSGAIVIGKKIPSKYEEFYESNPNGGGDIDGLDLVDFTFVPHYLAPDFPNVTETNVKKLSKELQNTIYAIDDATAIQIDGEKIKVVSEGQWAKFNK